MFVCEVAGVFDINASSRDALSSTGARQVSSGMHSGEGS